MKSLNGGKDMSSGTPGETTVGQGPPATGLVEGWVTASICVLLAAMVWAVFGQTLAFGFVNFDDNQNVYNNPDVAAGLGARSIPVAFTNSQIGHWDPLTTLSHMLDCQIFGLQPWGHHLTNVLLHAAAAILLFLVLRRMTGALWRSAFVAAVFAIHPLRAESVAWVSERKDVLSGVFFMLTIAAYCCHRSRQSRSWYWAALVLFTLGLMAKSMLVTLPFVLLLLDYWPLGNLARQHAAGPEAALPALKNRFPISWRLVFEKIPFFILSGIFCGAALIADKKEVVTLNKTPFAWHLANAAISCATYLRQMICPTGLAVPYIQLAVRPPVGETVFASLLLAAISASVFAWRRKHPFLVTGWLWYLGMLAPVIGLVQVGLQAHADRYTYLPQIGIYIMIAWGACEFGKNKRWAARLLPWLALTAVAVLMWCARIQVSYWKNDLTLWSHTLACTKDNYVAEGNLGTALASEGQLDAAISHLERALKIYPDYADNHYNYGLALAKKGLPDEAMVQYQWALRLNPAYPEALNNLGRILQSKGRLPEAIADYEKALGIQPDFAEALNNLGNAFLLSGQTDQAIARYQSALRIKPDYAEAENNLGAAFAQNGRWEEAVAHYEKAIQIKPDYVKAVYYLGIAFSQAGHRDEAMVQYERALQINPDYTDAQTDLAYLLATSPDSRQRDGARAEQLAGRANQLTGGSDPGILDALAAAYAEQGRFPNAMETEGRAVQLAGTQGDPAFLVRLQQHLKLYQAGRPLRENR